FHFAHTHQVVRLGNFGVVRDETGKNSLGRGEVARRDFFGSLGQELRCGICRVTPMARYKDEAQAQSGESLCRTWIPIQPQKYSLSPNWIRRGAVFEATPVMVPAPATS